MVTIEHILKIQAYLAAGVGVIPVLPFLPPWVLLTLTGALVVGIFADIKQLTILPERLGTLISIGFFVLFLVQVSFINLATPLLEFLCLLLAVRLAGQKTPRYILQMFLLASIILAGSSMLTLAPGYLIYLIIVVILVTTGLVLLSFLVTDPTLQFDSRYWHLLLKVTLILPAGSLVLMLLFFVILPRTQTPLWNFLNPPTKATAGISDRVQPGSVTDLSSNGALAFRAETSLLPPQQLYWRAITFSRIEGQSWRHETIASSEQLVKKPGQDQVVTIYAEPKTDSYLPALDRPVSILEAPRNQLKLLSDGTLHLRRPNNKKFRYQISARTIASGYQQDDLRRYLGIPAGLSRRIIDIGELLRNKTSFTAKREGLDQFFLQQRLNYSATRLPQTKDAIDTFLFVSKRGYCEYFASSYAVLLRLAGIPTRLVGGYLGGEYNQLGGYYLVTQDQAHVWIEALNDEGIWQRIDPSRLAINSSEAFAQANRPKVASWTAMLDLLEHNWSQLILNYDLRQQFTLLRSVFRGIKDLRNVTPAVNVKWSALVLFAGLMILLWLLRNRLRNQQYLVLRAYLKCIAKQQNLKKLPANAGLFDLARQTGNPLCQKFAQIYGQAIYQDKKLTSAELQQLKQIIQQLKKDK